MKLFSVLYDIYLAMEIMKMNNIPVTRIKGRGNHSPDFPMKLMQRCGLMVKSLTIDQGMIKMEVKSFSTDADMNGIIAKLGAFNCLDRVHSLKICSSYMTGEGFKLLSNFRNLKDLDLSCSWNIKGNDFNELGCIKTLERLDISNNYQLGKGGIEEVGFVKKLPILKYVNLKMTSVGGCDRWDDFKKDLIKNIPELELLCAKNMFES
jgi:hypothetical protein